MTELVQQAHRTRATVLDYLIATALEDIDARARHAEALEDLAALAGLLLRLTADDPDDPAIPEPCPPDLTARGKKRARMIGHYRTLQAGLHTAEEAEPLLVLLSILCGDDPEALIEAGVVAAMARGLDWDDPPAAIVRTATRRVLLGFRGTSL